VQKQARKFEKQAKHRQFSGKKPKMRWSENSTKQKINKKIN